MSSKKSCCKTLHLLLRCGPKDHPSRTAESSRNWYICDLDAFMICADLWMAKLHESWMHDKLPTTSCFASVSCLQKPGPRQSCFLTAYQTSGTSTCYFCSLCLDCWISIHCEHVNSQAKPAAAKTVKCDKVCLIYYSDALSALPWETGQCPWKWRAQECQMRGIQHNSALLSLHVPAIWRSLLTMTMSTCTCYMSHGCPCLASKQALGKGMRHRVLQQRVIPCISQLGGTWRCEKRCTQTQESVRVCEHAWHACIQHHSTMNSASGRLWPCIFGVATSSLCQCWLKKTQSHYVTVSLWSSTRCSCDGFTNICRVTRMQKKTFVSAGMSQYAYIANGSSPWHSASLCLIKRQCLCASQSSSLKSTPAAK